MAMKSITNKLDEPHKAEPSSHAYGKGHQYEYEYTINLTNTGEEGLMETFLNGNGLNYYRK